MRSIIPPVYTEPCPLQPVGARSDAEAMRRNEPWRVDDWAKALFWGFALAAYGHAVLLVADRDLLRAGVASHIGPFPNRRDFLLSLVVVFVWGHVGVSLHGARPRAAGVDHR